MILRTSHCSCGIWLGQRHQAVPHRPEVVTGVANTLGHRWASSKLTKIWTKSPICTSMSYGNHICSYSYMFNIYESMLVCWMVTSGSCLTLGRIVREPLQPERRTRQGGGIMIRSPLNSYSAKPARPRRS